MVRETRIVIVDTYAIIADLTGQVSSIAAKVLDGIRVGRIKGILHYLIVYELAYHWRRGRLPFRNEKELLEFIDTYFDIKPLDPVIAIEASRLKIVGDELLRNSGNPKLKRRKLSISDATTIVLATKLKTPIVTGDVNLSYVARSLGVKVIW